MNYTAVPKYTKWILMALLVVFPIWTMTVKKGGGRVFSFLLIFIFLMLVLHFKTSFKTLKQIVIKYWPLNLAMSGMFIVVLLHMIASGNYSLKKKYYEAPLSLACFLFILWVFMHLNSRELRVMQWGFVGGAIASAITLLILSEGGNNRPLLIGFEWRLIPYSGIALLMGCLALFSIGWSARNNKIGSVVMIMAACAGIYASYLSQSRGSWLAIPFFVFVFFMIFIKKNLKNIFSMAALALIAIVLSVSLNQNIKNRMEMAKSDIVNYANGENKNTSLGFRLQVWNASLQMFKEKPVFGIGPDYFREEVRKLAEKGEVTSEAVDIPHAHNDALFQMTHFGTFGIIATISVLFVPAFYFMNGTRHFDREMQTTGWMGLAMCGGIFIFGLTDVILKWKDVSQFYVIFIAALFAHYVKRKQELDADEHQMFASAT